MYHQCEAKDVLCDAHLIIFTWNLRDMNVIITKYYSSLGAIYAESL